ncbi:PRC-barrel domain-containing protein [Dactylosporangium sp. CA-233914]|uniref:PRC-barrel domain-containing protein n=1 Tax=Dactylosporangium sp. CA-233914 TaxID=3239934 RepID=UPI003D8CCE49
MTVVTLDGDDVADVKDVVFDGDTGRVRGFTLNGRGLFAGPLDKALPAGAVSSVGRDAVMTGAPGATVGVRDVVPRARARDSDVLANHVITEGGTDLGAVADVILEVSPGGAVDVVGYDIVAGPALYADSRRVLLPLPHTTAASGEAVVVPNEATQFVRQDLSEFGSAVAAFRRLGRHGEGGGADAVQ